MEACCIIKPSAVAEADALLEALERAGIRVKERKDIVYTEALVHGLYDHMSDAAREMIAGRLSGSRGIALRLEVESLERLLDVAGRESDPAACAPGSIRFRFGNGAAKERVGDWPWWENAFHRPVDSREQERDLRLCFP